MATSESNRPALRLRDVLSDALIRLGIGIGGLVWWAGQEEELLGVLRYAVTGVAVAAGLALFFRPAWKNEAWLVWFICVSVYCIADLWLRQSWILLIILAFTGGFVFYYFKGLDDTPAAAGDDADDVDITDDDEGELDEEEVDEEEEDDVEATEVAKRPHPVGELLALTDDNEVCDRLFGRIVNHYGDNLDASELPVEERAVLLPYHAMSIMREGGFSDLFEARFKGDPHFHLTAAALTAIEATRASKAFRRALALFPGSKPPADTGTRLGLYRRAKSDVRHEIDCAFWDAQAEIVARLAAYARAHADAYAHLEEMDP